MSNRYLCGSRKLSLYSCPKSTVTSTPTTIIRRIITDVGMGKLTAASSGLNAPFAILCFPGLSFLLLIGLFVSGLTVSNASHSASVGMWPSNTAKNLCRRTILIRSKACAEYQPSRSCFACASQCFLRGNGKKRTDIAYFSQVFVFSYHLHEHGIFDIAKLERSCVFRDIKSIENMSFATINASARSHSFRVSSRMNLPPVCFLGDVVIVYLTGRIDVRRTLAAANNRRSRDGMIRVPEVYPLISAGNSKCVVRVQC